MRTLDTNCRRGIVSGMVGLTGAVCLLVIGIVVSAGNIASLQPSLEWAIQSQRWNLCRQLYAAMGGWADVIGERPLCSLGEITLVGLAIVALVVTLVTWRRKAIGRA